MDLITLAAFARSQGIDLGDDGDNDFDTVFAFLCGAVRVYAAEWERHDLAREPGMSQALSDLVPDTRVQMTLQAIGENLE